jgi:hypothetical protein
LTRLWMAQPVNLLQIPHLQPKQKDIL